MTDNGYIALHRKMLNWEWYTDGNKMRVFIHCLLKANWTDGRFRGHEIKRGSFVTSYSTMAKELKMTVDQVRYAIRALEFTTELTHENCGNFLVVTVVAYDEYQIFPTCFPQDSHQVPTRFPTIEKRNKNNKKRNISAAPKNWSSTCNQRDIDFDEIEKTMLANGKEN